MVETPEFVRNRIVLHFQDERLLKGYTHDFTPLREKFHLISEQEEDKGNIYVDTCVSLLPVGTMERLVDNLGVERILFGSDMPYLNLGGQLGKVLMAKFGDDVKKKILAGNAKKLFRFD